MISEAILLIALTVSAPYSLDDARADIAVRNFDTAIVHLERMQSARGSGDEVRRLLLHSFRMRASRNYHDNALPAAVADLQNVLRLQPGDAGALRDLAAVYTALGAELLRVSDTVAAERALRESVRLEPANREPRVILAFINVNRGQALEKSGRLREAISEYRRALEWDTAFLNAHILLGRLYYEREDFALAKHHLDEARRLAVHRIQGLDELMENIKREESASVSYETVEMDGFTVRWKGAQRYDLFYQILPDLRDARTRASMLLERSQQMPLTVIVYSGGDYRAAADAPDWSQGLYDGKIRIREASALMVPQKVAKLLRHEVAHAVIEEVAPGRVPAWIHEGIAQYLEGEQWDPPSDIGYFQEASRDRRLIKLSALNQEFSRIPAGADVRLAYAQSAAAIHYLVKIHGRPILAELLLLLSSGRTPEEAIETITFLDLDSFQGRVNDWVLWEYGR